MARGKGENSHFAMLWTPMLIAVLLKARGKGVVRRIGADVNLRVGAESFEERKKRDIQDGWGCWFCRERARARARGRGMFCLVSFGIRWTRSSRRADLISKGSKARGSLR